MSSSDLVVAPAPCPPGPSTRARFRARLASHAESIAAAVGEVTPTMTTSSSLSAAAMFGEMVLDALMPPKATTFLDSVRVDFHSTGNSAMAPSRTNTATSEYRLIINRRSYAHVDDPLTEADLGAPLWTGANRLDGGSARASLTVAPVLTWTWRTRPHS
jgi:hypothetical protein